MHTVRNRIASRPSSTPSAQAENTPPVQRSSRHELARLLRHGAPVAAPVPDPVLALPTVPLTAAAWPAPVLCASQSSISGIPAARTVPQRAAHGDDRPQTRRNPKGKKARKAAARKAAMAVAAPKPPDTRGAKRPKQAQASASVITHLSPLPPPAAASSAIPPAEPVVHPLPSLAFGSAVMLELCLQAEPALALTLPSRPEPLVDVPEPEPQPETPAEAEPALARVLTLAEMPELLVTEMPIAAMPVAVTEPLAASPAAALAALAALAEAQSAPVPRSRALVPARRQGLVDVIAFLLRDSGRRLARWSARRHKSRAEQDLLRRAEARQHAQVSELEALDALRRRGGQNRG